MCDVKMFVTKFDINNDVSGDSLTLKDCLPDEGKWGRSNFCQTFRKGVLLLNFVPGANKQSADNAGGIQRLAVIKLINDKGKQI
jgi:hypothetical protein